jgi:hypothetical protein
MITEERVLLERPPRRRPSDAERRLSVQAPERLPASTDYGLLWRVVLVLSGFGVAMLGWVLVMTAILAFIGLPLFFFGLALMQAQER